MDGILQLSSLASLIEVCGIVFTTLIGYGISIDWGISKDKITSILDATPKQSQEWTLKMPIVGALDPTLEASNCTPAL